MWRGVARRAGGHWVRSKQGRKAVRRRPAAPPYPVQVPQSQEFWDTPSIKVAAGMVLVVVLAKLTMMYDESQEPERIERQAKEFAEAQESLKPLTREQWDEIQELRPRTPYESRIGRPNAHIRTGEPLSLEDVKDWATDVLTDVLERKEDSLRCSVK